MVVLAVYAYDVGGASAVGLAALVRLLPAAFAAPITSLLADRSSRRDFEATTPIPERQFALLRSCSLFAPLPLATVENLAAQLVPVTATRARCSPPTGSSRRGSTRSATSRRRPDMLRVGDTITSPRGDVMEIPRSATQVHPHMRGLRAIA